MKSNRDSSFFNRDRWQHGLISRHLVVGAVVCITLGTTATVRAQDSDALISIKQMKVSLALKAAQAAMEDCRNRGFQVAVAVTDRFGLLQAFVRDRFAGAHTVEVAQRKAWTAASFKIPTTQLAVATAAGTEASGIRGVPGV
ncbi:MAG: heme-binding protein, partial [Burkholderiaceae bacterium]